MEKYTNLLDKIYHTKFVGSILLVILSVIAYKLVIYFLMKSESKINKFTNNKGKTYIKLIKSAIKYIFIVITVLMVLQLNGINVSSILAGVGIFGVVFGLAIQDWLKDIIRGSSIITDNYFKVGDIVKYKDIYAKVLVIGLKTTKIQDIKSKNTLSIANRNIEEIEVISEFVTIEVPMPYEVKVATAEKVIDEIISNIKKFDNVNNCRNLGVNELADSYIEYLLQIDCKKEYRFQVRRNALREVLLVLDKHKIEVPYPQMDVHRK